MANILTTSDQKRKAFAWFRQWRIEAGMDPNYPPMCIPDLQQAAKNVFDELINRDFSDIDRDIGRLSGRRINFTKDPTRSYDLSHRRTSPDDIAKYIVFMAQQLGLYWDDTLKSIQEEEIFKRTRLGKAVYEAGQYISAIKPKVTKTGRAKTTQGTSATSSTAAKSGKPVGPQSGNVRDLKNTTKVQASESGNLIFYITGIIKNADPTKKPNKVVAHIKPLQASGASGSTNKVFIGSGRAYTDCVCFFDDPKVVQDFLTELENNNRVPVNVENLHVEKTYADRNGYFIVGTEFGEVAIKASNLNEALIESADTWNWSKATTDYSKEELKQLDVDMLVRN